MSGIARRHRLAAAAAAALLPFATLAAAPDGLAKKKRCKARSEKQGCKLAVNSDYAGLGEPGRETVRLRQLKGVRDLVLYGTEIKCEAGSQVSDFSLTTEIKKPGRMKVGKTYHFEKRNAGSSGGTTYEQTITGDATVKSAKTVAVTVSYLDVRNGQTICTGKTSGKLKRVL